MTLHSCTSDGSYTLSEYLRIAVFDYVRQFGKEPRLILIPYWRRGEMLPADDSHVRGVRFRFSIISDAIELLGTP